MSMNKVKLSQILGDFKITLDSDDYVNNVSDVALRNIALRGIREFGFDLSKKVKSLKLSINTSNNTVSLPEDFAGLNKVGIVGSDQIVYVLHSNENINYSRRLEVADDDSVGDRTDTFDESPLNIENNSISDRVDDKGSTSSTTSDNDFDFYVFQNYLYQGGYGRLYGAGGGYGRGAYRLNLDQDRIELDMNTEASEVVIEYVADEARAGDPEIHVYAEEALRCYIYYKIVERKATVPANEKTRARTEYYNERRKANARLSTFSKQEILKTIRKNFRQVPKY